MASPIYEIDIITLVYGGEAMGRLPDGRAVFVPFALPGERVQVRLVEQKRGFARGELLDIIRPSPVRIEPRCAHFSVCGGCQYQHVQYGMQLKTKEAILRDQLERIGKIQDPPVEETVPSPSPWYYRNHIQFHFTPDGRLGYQKAGSDEVIPIRECHLPVSDLNETWPRLEMEPFPGLQRIGLRSGVEEDVMLVLETDGDEAPELLVEEMPVSVVELNPSGSLVLAGSGELEISVSGRSFRVSAGSFFQVNISIAQRMISYLLENLPLSPEVEVLDVYCGVGLFSAFMAPRVARLSGIESSPTACSDFENNMDEFDHVELYEATAEQALPNIQSHPGIVLVDPPRAGLGRRVVDEIFHLSPGVLAYISCDPATLARDARMLVEGGYSLLKATPFDMFPQTYHIESISLWQH